MKLFLTRVIPALLILALASVSGGASAEREQGSRDNRDTGLQFRGQFRDDSHNDFRSGQNHPRNYDSRNYDSRNYDSRNDDQRNDPRTEAVYQRLYDDRREDNRYDNREDSSSYRPGYNRGGQRPVNDVVREVQNRYGGQVIGVQNSDGGSMYRVRVLQRDGRVKNVMVPAE